MGPIITSIVNLCLAKGCLPASFTHPFIKEPSLKLLPNLYSNFILKILEKLLTNCLSYHLLFHGLAFQFAYYTYHSTETTLLTIHNHVMGSSDNRKVTALVLLDLCLLLLTPLVIEYSFTTSSTGSVYLISLGSHLAYIPILNQFL